MRVRCGGTVLNVERRVVLAVCSLCALLLLVVSGLLSSVQREAAPDIEPTPIDRLLDKLMNDRHLDVAARHAQLADVGRAARAAPQPPVAAPQTQTVVMKMGAVRESRASELKAALQLVTGLNNRPPDSHYSINVTLSDATSLDRDLPDTRPPVCATLRYNTDQLPRCTVIIPFFNEAPTMILRALHSILNRSPAHLLEEIILVDDMSFDAPLKAPLQHYIDLLPNVRLIRHRKRSGLIVARMIGARQAKTPVIIFLDAHTEVNVGWLEPMLDQLQRNKKQVLQPFIDGIDMRTLVFSSPPIYYKGAFSWDLRYTWLKLTDHEQQQTMDTGEPFFTPTLVGCAIAVYKDYFFEIGAFDEGLRVWGGENLELAFRVWMCGGQATTVTCSRVGHVFKQSPNKFDGTEGTKEQTVQRNLMRVADAWMDNARKFFYATSLIFDFKRFKLEDSEKTSLRERVKQRQSMKCHNFDWYLYNVIPEMDLPPMNGRYFGEIMNLHTRACWEITDDYFVGMTYFCFEHKIIPKNNFVLTSDGLMRYRDKCVKIVAPKPFLVLAECPTDHLEEFGVWNVTNHGPSWGLVVASRRNEDGSMAYWCVTQVTNVLPEHLNEQMPQLAPCRDNDLFQVWGFTYGLNYDIVPEYLTDYSTV